MDINTYRLDGITYLFSVISKEIGTYRSDFRRNDLSVLFLIHHQIFLRLSINYYLFKEMQIIPIIIMISYNEYIII